MWFLDESQCEVIEKVSQGDEPAAKIDAREVQVPSSLTMPVTSLLAKTISFGVGKLLTLVPRCDDKRYGARHGLEHAYFKRTHQFISAGAGYLHKALLPHARWTHFFCMAGLAQVLRILRIAMLGQAFAWTYLKRAMADYARDPKRQCRGCGKNRQMTYTMSASPLQRSMPVRCKCRHL